ncbi:MAG TPA: transglycosylase domain-containing protein [Cyclobacteriaceae bacterium]|nr:transglycosylase domain-containing protein [Cyclobacteriaceae bacterium]
MGLQKTWFKKAIKYTWIMFGVIIIGLPLYMFLVSINLFGLFGEMPNVHEIENPKNDLSSELISADGVSLGRYYRSNRNRSQVGFEELSKDLVETLVISEDHRFYEHSGIDIKGLVRAVFGAMTFSHQGGGSTLTQQLAKALFTQNQDNSLDGHLAGLGKWPKRIIQKNKEWIISVYLERNFTKEEILTMYLNTAEYVNQSFGIKVAAENHFQKQPDSLNLQESALLVGMLQNPALYNPAKRPELALSKRNDVLWKVYQHGYKIKTREQYDSISALPLGLNFKVQNENEGMATYFRTIMQNHLLAYCKARNIDLYNSGLRIYTTIDSRLQKYAEESLTEHMATLQKGFTEQWKLRKMDPWLDENGNQFKDFIAKRIKTTPQYKAYVKKWGEGDDSVNLMLKLKKPMKVFSWKGERDTTFNVYDSLNYYKRFLQAGMMAMDPTTGSIKAWVGGINHKFFKFDHVKQQTRQAGSTFKPFVYGLAMDEGYSPCYELYDISPAIPVPGGQWYPPNSDGSKGSGEKMTIRHAMALSINTITAQMMMKVGPQNVVDFAKRCGIESKLDAVPSLCLGVSDVSIFEMVGAYSTFVNSGIHTRPTFISRIEDKNGNVIEAFVPQTREGLNDQTAYKMVHMLRGGVEEEGGTSGGLPRELKIDNEIGGKTGTTNDASDGWYMGITHDLVVGTWVGGDERAIRFPSWTFGQGIKTARPIFANFMLKAYADKESGVVKGRFNQPRSGLPFLGDCSRHNDADSVQVVPTERWKFN